MATRRTLALACLYAALASQAAAAQSSLPPDMGALPGQKTIQVRLAQPSRTMSSQDVRAAFGGALAAWNAVLPGDLRLVESASGTPPPAGEVMIELRFDNDPAHFGKSGIDEIGDTRMVIDRGSNTAVIGIFLVDAPGSLSSNGAPVTRDLQLVMMHELGHALGVQHDQRGAAEQTIMSAALDNNSTLLARTHTTLAALRQVTAEDRSLLDIAMLKRRSRDVAGSYTGALKVAELVSGNGNIALGTMMPVRDGDCVVSYAAGKVVLVYKGSRRELPIVDLLRAGVTLDFPNVADGRALRTISIKRGNTPNEILVDAEIAPLNGTYQIKGALTRK